MGVSLSFSSSGVVREERSKAEKEYFQHLVEEGMYQIAIVLHPQSTYTIHVVLTSTTCKQAVY